MSGGGALPKPQQTLQRVTFKTSRLAEFSGRRELVAQTGHAVEDWPLVILKELVDNTLDAAEETRGLGELDRAGADVSDRSLQRSRGAERRGSRLQRRSSGCTAAHWRCSRTRR
jgi:hypothetical protein